MEIELGFNDEYVIFYTEFFNDRIQALELLTRCYELTDRDVRPRRIVNNIARLIKLADDQMIIRGGRYGIQIFFWMVCIEAIYNISEPSKYNRDKITVIRKFFNECISIDDKIFILEHFRRSIADYRWKYAKDLHMNIIANIFYFIRHDFVHEGDYSTFHFSSSNTTNMLNNIKLREFREDVIEDRIYEVSITFEQTRRIIVNGCLTFLYKHIELIV